MLFAARSRLGVVSKHISPRAPSLRDISVSSAMVSTTMEVERIPALSDNYIWLCHDPGSTLTAVVDPAEAGGVEKILQEKGWKLSHIFNTHHHGDHTGANMYLKKKYGCTIVGPRADKDRIPGIDETVGDGDVFMFGSQEVKVFDTPGHTRGHIVFYIPTSKALFSGDTLFALGCGRLFEGTPQQMWTSLSKIMVLPDDTSVYCAHEYTQSNARFAVSVDPANEALKARKEDIDRKRSQGIPTVPSMLGEEKATNPFLRAADPGLRAAMGMASSDIADWEVFGAVRKAKDKA